MQAGESASEVVYHLTAREIASISRESLLGLLHRHGVLLVDNQPIDANTFVALATRLGTLEEVKPAEHQLTNSPTIRLQSNIPGYGVSGGGTYWHADSPWYEPPAVATMLLCAEAPESTGDTLFVNMQALLASLPRDFQESLGRLSGRYPCKEVLEREHRAMGIYHPEMIAAFSNIVRPLVRKHPVTGEKALYLNEKWLESIDTLDRASGDELLTMLYRRLSTSEFQYRHKWKKEQVLIWDNNKVAHKALPVTDGSRKITWRIIISRYNR